MGFFVPSTTRRCLAQVLVGVVLAFQAIYALRSEHPRVPQLEVVVAIIAAVCVLGGIAGLVAPGRRRR